MPGYLVVGDVHGCSEELDELLRLVADPGRQVVFVGDLIAKGPDARGVLARARELSALGVRGNHDQRGIEWHDAILAGRPAAVSKPSRRRAFESLKKRDWAYLRALPYFLRIEAENVIVVHAGLVPGVALEAQRARDMIMMRSLRPDGSPTPRIEDGVPWASCWPGPELVLFGHDAVRKLQRHGHAVGLDTGCVYGGKLTAMLLPERELVSVPAKRVWSPPGGGAG